jgi:hypothetical protein
MSFRPKYFQRVCSAAQANTCAFTICQHAKLTAWHPTAGAATIQVDPRRWRSRPWRARLRSAGAPQRQLHWPTRRGIPASSAAAATERLASVHAGAIDGSFTCREVQQAPGSHRSVYGDDAPPPTIKNRIARLTTHHPPARRLRARWPFARTRCP